jgi:hypothetical protein
MSRSSRKRKLQFRRAAALHPMSEDMEAAFREIEQQASQPAAETHADRSTLTQEARSNA